MRRRFRLLYIVLFGIAAINSGGRSLAQSAVLVNSVSGNRDELSESNNSSRFDEKGIGQIRRMASFVEDHIALDLGAGFNAPIGNDIPYITWGSNFTIGGGVHLSGHSTVLAEYQFIGDKLPGGLIAQAGTKGGHAHIWSFTLNPIIDLFPRRHNSLYLTGGGGFYRKVTSFTEPGQYQNYVVGHFSSNQPGGSVGFGITHRMRWATNSRVFFEARYLFINTPPITVTNGLGTTELVPVTVGVRW